MEYLSPYDRRGLMALAQQAKSGGAGGRNPAMDQLKNFLLKKFKDIYTEQNIDVDPKALVADVNDFTYELMRGKLKL